MVKLKPFRERFTLSKRKEEAAKIRDKYKDRIPVIVESLKGANLPVLDKLKYLVPEDLTIAQFAYVIRSRMKLSADQSIWLFVESGAGSKQPNMILPPASHTVATVHHTYANEDGFLYITYSCENVFGQD